MQVRYCAHMAMALVADDRRVEGAAKPWPTGVSHE
jgi:hypothetical protein